jgi:hypothetical protein
MSKPTLPRAGAACGAIFSIALFVAAGDNSRYATVRVIAAGVALVLFLPFLAGLHAVLRDAEGERPWLSTAAVAAGVAGITLKLVSGAPDIAMHRAHVADGTQLHSALEGVAGAVTVISLYPLALMCAAIAVLTLRTGALPRWLGTGAAVSALALAVNGCFLTADFVPALVLFMLWTLVASVTLFRRADRASLQRPARAAAG